MKLKCNICQNSFIVENKPGALISSPPKNDMTRKWHVCSICYENKLLTILRRPNDLG